MAAIVGAPLSMDSGISLHVLDGALPRVMKALGDFLASRGYELVAEDAGRARLLEGVTAADFPTTVSIRGEVIDVEIAAPFSEFLESTVVVLLDVHGDSDDDVDHAATSLVCRAQKRAPHPASASMSAVSVEAIAISLRALEAQLLMSAPKPK